MFSEFIIHIDKYRYLVPTYFSPYIFLNYSRIRRCFLLSSLSQLAVNIYELCFEMSATIFSSNIIVIQAFIISLHIIILTNEVDFLIHFIFSILVYELLIYKYVFFFHHE